MAVSLKFIGVDVGTSGVRAVVISETGELTAESSVSFHPNTLPYRLPYHEQDARYLLNSVLFCLQQIAHEGKSAVGIAITSTSGTFLAVDKLGAPLSNAILYNDNRAIAEAEKLKPLAEQHRQEFGYGFPSSFTLPKILWIKNNQPDLFDKASAFLTINDLVNLHLTGLPLEELKTDVSSALKMGCDPRHLLWSETTKHCLNINIDKLPRLGIPGDICGYTSSQQTQLTGLPANIPVFLGATDGITSALASGTKKPGDWNSTLGTTLIVRGISNELIRDPSGSIYCHAHPDGWWMPGGASNVGGEWIKKWFPNANPAEMDRLAENLLPIKTIAYPLAVTGERLPFQNAAATDFIEPETQDPVQRYAACLQGTAMTERWIFDLLSELGADVGNTIYSTGGGTKSGIWMQLRADVTGRQYIVPKYPSAAIGAAILAARTHFGSVASTVSSMVKPEKIYEPTNSSQFEEYYQQFRALTASEYDIRNDNL